MSSGLPADLDGIDAGKYLVRLGPVARRGWRDRFLTHLLKLSWRTPLHNLRLRGRYPLKLLTIPEDPVRGDVARGREMLDGVIRWRGEAQDIETCDFVSQGGSPGFVRYLHSFAWLRDLGALQDRERAAPVAEQMMRAWLAAHGDTISDPAWSADLAASRVLFWVAHAPLILSSADVVYRSAVLSALARTARHLERVAPRTAPGVAQIKAWAAVTAAGLLMPGGDARRDLGEAALDAALDRGLTAEGGPICRQPDRLMDLITTLEMLHKVYEARGQPPEPCIVAALSHSLSVLLGLVMGDGGLSSWQGALPADKIDVDALIRASAVRTRARRQARDWGYHRLEQAKGVLVLDAAPPPIGQQVTAGCASTLAFEFSDGPYRLIVNCGGAQAGGGSVPDVLAQALRTTAAHSTFVLADSNSTALRPDGGLGKGVTEVEVERQEGDGGSRIIASHNGYARRFGFEHRRSITLMADGRDLRGEDVLAPISGRKSQAGSFAVRFHLGLGVEAQPTADGQGALLRLPDGGLWQFRAQGGALGIDDSIWVDGLGQMHATVQLVVSGEAPAGGALVNWAFKRASR
ncbi:MAG: heparinase II/III family protein [Chakrabartia sp.]